MEFAINKTTGEKVSAREIGVNPSYTKFREDEWWADPDYIASVNPLLYKSTDCVPVCFRDGHYRDGSLWSSCWALYPGDRKNVTLCSESVEHKLGKRLLWNLANSHKLVMKYADNKTISWKSLDWRKFKEVHEEVTIANKNSKQRADILIPLVERDLLLGDGIVFEVQLSPQKEEDTKKRTYHYASKGYSVIWIWPKDFTKYDPENPKWYEEEEDLFLNKSEFYITTCHESLLEVGEYMRNNLAGFVQHWSREIDNKHEKQKEDLQKQTENHEKKLIEAHAWASGDLTNIASDTINKIKKIMIQVDDLRTNIEQISPWNLERLELERKWYCERDFFECLKREGRMGCPKCKKEMTLIQSFSRTSNKPYSRIRCTGCEYGEWASNLLK